MKKSYLYATVGAFALVGWMLAGQVAGPPIGAAVTDHPGAISASTAMTVEVTPQTARDVARTIVSQGEVRPNRTVTLRAETEGQVKAVVVAEGRAVRTGDLLVRLDIKDRKARLEKAKAVLRERRRSHDAAVTLGKKGYQTQRRVDETYSALRTAEADLEQIRLEIANTEIRAPFDGILEQRQVEVGDYIAVNGEIASVVDNDPLIVTVQIAQRDIGKITKDVGVRVAFATGQFGDGSVRLIAPRAEEETRTFRVEIAVPNPGSRIRSGTSAEARIPTGTELAHFVSPALLSLDDAGKVGIKTVDDDTVVFHPITIVQAEANGAWVSGLPVQANIITVGQGFVNAGEKVRTANAANETPKTPAATPSGQ